MLVSVDLSPGPLLASFLVSTIGFGVFLYGKKQTRGPQLVAGLVLMVVPGFLGSAFGILALGGVVLGALWGALRAGL